jgi:hypothetical protein
LHPVRKERNRDQQHRRNRHAKQGAGADDTCSGAAIARDSRFTVAMPMAPSVLGTPQVQIPSLSMLGEIDSRVNNPAVRAAYAAAAPPKLKVEIGDAGHYAFSDLCFPSPDCQAPATRSQIEAHDLVLRWAVPFLRRYLAGDLSYEPLLAEPGPAGASVEAQR